MPTAYPDKLSFFVSAALHVCECNTVLSLQHKILEFWGVLGIPVELGRYMFKYRMGVNLA